MYINRADCAIDNDIDGARVQMGCKVYTHSHFIAISI